MKKHAYLIMAYNEFHMLKKLLEELDDERNDIYIHIDKRTKYVDQEEIASWVKKSNIFFIPRRNIYWGHISIVKCELDLLKVSTKMGYDYYHLLSGMDFPLKTQDEIHAFFEHEDSEFVPYHRDGDHGDRFLYKIRYFFPLLRFVGRGDHEGPGRKKQLLRKLGQWQWKLSKFQEKRGVDRIKNFRESDIVKGSQWFSITHAFAKCIVSKEMEILRRYRLTNGPDEFFVPMLAMNSFFADRVKNTDLREIDWSRGNPYEYTFADLDMLKDSKALFARKISFDRNPDLVEGLIRHLHPEDKKETRPLVSVIVPCFNVEDYISECVDSLLSQSYSKLEILLIDDGSTDKTKDLAKAYAEKHENVHYHRRNNGGLSAARNTGIKLAKGEYIAFVDSDDWVEATFIERLYGAVSHNGADMAVCGYWKEGTDKVAVTFDGDKLMSSHAAMRILGDIYPKENVLMVVAWNKLYKRALFDDIRFPKGRIHEDEFCAHRIIGKTEAIATVSETLYHYRDREGSITSSCRNHDLNHLDYIDALYDRLKTVRGMLFGDLTIYMLYTYFEGIKQLMVRYSDKMIMENNLYQFFRRKAAFLYLRFFGEMDTYQKKDYMKLILSPKKYRREVIRKMDQDRKA